MSSKQPNVIVIIMDDLTWGDLECHGNKDTQTPNLDRLFNLSTRMEQYRSGFLCTPARAAIMTGRHPYRTRAIDTYCGRSMIDPDEQTIASYLRDAGYSTCLSGKWHLGDTYPNRPIDLGFDECLMHHGGGLCQPANYGHDDYFDPILSHNGKRVKSEGYCTDIFTEHSMRFIREHKEDPFFIYLATNAPHTPAIVHEVWYKRYIEKGYDEKMAKIYGMVDNIDFNVGRIMSLLDELNLTDDTIVMYTSDHGMCPSSIVKDGKGRFNAGLKGGKGTPYDGGVKVPCFWRWPNHFPENKSLMVNTNPIDVFPTLKSLCGIETETRNSIDGLDFSAQLKGEEPSSEQVKRQLPMQWHRGDVPEKRRNFLIMEGPYKCCSSDGWGGDKKAKAELYHMLDDPNEKNDLADEQVERVIHLLHAYDQWFDEVSETRENNYAPTPIVVGSEKENPVILNRNDWRCHNDDGWGPETEAHWEIDVHEGHVYDIRCELEPLDENRKLFLTLGDQRFEQDLPAGVDSLTFNETLKPGQAQLESWAVGESRQTVKFVIIEHTGKPADEIREAHLP